MSRIADTPFGRAVLVGRVAGVPVYVHWSLAVLLGLLTMLLGNAELPALAPGSSTAAYWAAGVATAVAFVGSVAAHELAHALVARHFGVPVERTTLWMLGGLTELRDEAPTPRADALVAGAGPGLSIVAGVVFGALAALADPTRLLGSALAWLGSVNLVLAVFNLLPGAPLDGGRLLRALIWHRTGDRDRARRAAGRVGRLVGDGILVLSVLAILAGDASGLWLALVGLFVIAGARGEESFGPRATGLRARDVMDPAPLVCPDWWTLEQFLASIASTRTGQAAFPLVDTDGRATGALVADDLEAAVRIGAVSARASRLHRGLPIPLVNADADLDDVVRAIHFRGGLAVVVDPAGHPIGIVEERTIVRAARLARLDARGTAWQAAPTGQAASTG